MKTKILMALGIGCLLAINVSTISLINEINDEFILLKDSHQVEMERIEALKDANETIKEEMKKLKAERWLYKGEFEVTGYCNCEACCGKWAYGPTKSGKMPKEGRTVAVDPELIPLGTEIVVGRHVYVAEDTGSAIKGKKIDIYFNNHAEAKKFGRQKREVFI